MKNYLKRCLAYVLSFVLTLGMCTIAYGETTAKVQAKVTTDIVKELALIGMYYWNTEQLKSAEKMTDEQWIEFFKYTDEYLLNITAVEREQAIKDNYGADYDIYSQLTEEEIYEYEEVYYRVRPIYDNQEKRYFKLINNYPNPDGINIKFDDEFLDFGSDLPIDSSTGVYIPVNDLVMNQLGLDYNYDEATKILTVKLGETEVLQCTDEDYLEVGVYPSLIRDSNGKLYMDINILDIFLEYYVSFVQSEEIYIITDKQKLITGIDKNFTIMNKLVSELNSKNSLLSENTKAALAAALVLYGDTENSQAGIQSSFDMNQYNGSFKVKGTLNIDSELLLKLYEMQYSYYFSPTEMNSTIAALRNQLEVFKDTPYELIYNAETDLYYLKCEAVNKVQGIEENTWLKISAYDFSYFFDFNIETIGRKIVEDSYGDMNMYTPNVEYYKSIIGDKRFTKKSSNGVDTYTASYSSNKNNTTAVYGYNMLLGYTYLNLSNVSGNISFSEDKDGIKEIHLSGKSTLDIGIPMNISYKSDITREKTDIQFEAVGEFGGKVTANFTSDNSEADNSAVLFVPPAGENVVDY